MEQINNIISQVKSFMQHAGPAWDIFVITFASITILFWIDLVIGNKIRVTSTGLFGIFLERILNWYSLKKNIAKAKSLKIAFRKRYWVVPIAGRYHVINNLQRKRINRILLKHHMVININDLLNQAVYHTK